LMLDFITWMILLIFPPLLLGVLVGSARSFLVAATHAMMYKSHIYLHFF
jgi:hypothetical protein